MRRHKPSLLGENHKVRRWATSMTKDDMRGGSLLAQVAPLQTFPRMLLRNDEQSHVARSNLSQPVLIASSSQRGLHIGQTIIIPNSCIS